MNVLEKIQSGNLTLMSEAFYDMTRYVDEVCLKKVCGNRSNCEACRKRIIRNLLKECKQYGKQEF